MRLHVYGQVVSVELQDGHVLKLDADEVVAPGTYHQDNVPDPVGTQLAQFFYTTGRGRHLMQTHGRVKEIEVYFYRPIEV